MDLCLRADPGAADGRVATRPCCVEVNYFGKLCKLLVEMTVLDPEENLDDSTMDRLIREILRKNSARLTFSKADRNACQHCKLSEHVILRLTFEIKLLERDNAGSEVTTAKKALLSFKLASFESQNARDAAIRKYVHCITDRFKVAENLIRSQSDIVDVSWRSRKNIGISVHQDDATRVNVPHFSVQSQADLTAFHQDVNGNVSTVTNGAIVFTHDQGGGSKNGSSIVETIILNHLLTCQGEDMLFVFFDCANAGRNYVTSVALSSYLVENGLARIVVVGFLENCHGKFLADMLFGQFQRKAKNVDFASVDGMLEVFQSLRRSGSAAQGFVINPLSCVDWKENFESLGYAVTPHRNFVNAIAGVGPRDSKNRKSVQMYPEPPFPIVPNTSA